MQYSVTCTPVLRTLFVLVCGLVDYLRQRQDLEIMNLLAFQLPSTPIWSISTCCYEVCETRRLLGIVLLCFLVFAFLRVQLCGLRPGENARTGKAVTPLSEVSTSTVVLCTISFFFADTLVL